MRHVIFVGGSIAVRQLPSVVEHLLDYAMDNGAGFVIGDAPGVDTMVQSHLANSGYRDVLIYCMSRARNNVGNWPIKHHRAPSGLTGSEWYAVKDHAMASDASSGLMVWNGSSRGTRANIITILQSGKPCTVWDGTLRSYVSYAEFLHAEAAGHVG
jgi:hypothetical protein